MILICKKNEYELLKYEPTILHPFYDDMDPISLFTRVRFLIEYFYGYQIFYLKRQKELIGFCAVSSGRNKRYWFANDSDIIFGPYFIKEKYRGRGYSFILLDLALKHAGLVYQNAYDYINNDNTPSIRVTERLGGKRILSIDINQITRMMKLSENGQYGVYKICNERRM